MYRKYFCKYGNSIDFLASYQQLTTRRALGTEGRASLMGEAGRLCAFLEHLLGVCHIVASIREYGWNTNFFCSMRMRVLLGILRLLLVCSSKNDLHSRWTLWFSLTHCVQGI